MFANNNTQYADGIIQHKGNWTVEAFLHLSALITEPHLIKGHVQLLSEQIQ